MPTRTDRIEPSREPVEGLAAPLVLIAEYDEALRACMVEVLTDAGYRAVPACNSAEAVSAPWIEHIDLLVVDLVIPEQKGIETILYVRRHFPNVKAIAISSADLIHLNAARELGACAVLYEPFSSGDLVRTVEFVCGRGSQPESGTSGMDKDPSAPEGLPAYSPASQ
jgi:two-component system, chemotaxis family, chemotaxis protein CheY